VKTLVATNDTQGRRRDDYAWTVEGELVYVPPFDCCSPGCGCDRGFAGFASARATTTAMVVDRPDLSVDDHCLALVDALTRQGWLEPGWSAEHDEILADHLGPLERITGAFPAGTVIERAGTLIAARTGPGATGLVA
jgi:hypothetical protein